MALLLLVPLELGLPHTLRWYCGCSCVGEGVVQIKVLLFLASMRLHAHRVKEIGERLLQTSNQMRGREGREASYRCGSGKREIVLVCRSRWHGLHDAMDVCDGQRRWCCLHDLSRAAKPRCSCPCLLLLSLSLSLPLSPSITLFQ